MDEKRRDRKSYRPTHDSIVWSRWYHSAPPVMRNRMCTVSTLCTVSIPMTSIVALPTLKIPYFALNESRSPTGKGTAGDAWITGWEDEAGGADEVEEPTILPVHTVSWAPSDRPAVSRASTIIAEPPPRPQHLIRFADRTPPGAGGNGLEREAASLGPKPPALGPTRCRRRGTPRPATAPPL